MVRDIVGVAVGGQTVGSNKRQHDTITRFCLVHERGLTHTQFNVVDGTGCFMLLAHYAVLRFQGRSFVGLQSD